MTGILEKTFRIVRRRLRGPTRNALNQQPHWRTVQHGPLAGRDFFVPTGNGRGWGDRIVAGTYEPRLLGELRELARNGGRLYDIGSHVGFFTGAWMHLGGKGVDAFEPLPTNRTVVQKTVARNGWQERVSVHPMALGNFEGEGKLRVDEAHLGSTSMAFVEEIGGIDAVMREGKYQPDETLEVAVRRLDDVVREEHLPAPAVIKIDVEGAEASVIDGATEVLANDRPCVLVEIHNIDSGLQVAQQMAELDYGMDILSDNKGMPVCKWFPK